MDKEKIKQQRSKLKENALKVLHVLCYILSGLFLLTLLISGLQSCGGKKGATSVSAETIDEYTYVYKAPQFVQSTDYQFLANSPQEYYAWLTETLGGRTLPQDSNKYDYYACAEDTYIEFTDTDGNKYGANNIRFHYAKHEDGVGNTYWLLDYVDLCIKVNTPAGTSAYTNVYVWCATNSNTGLVVFSRGYFTMPVKLDLPYVFSYTEVLNQSLRFEFNKQFNYNAGLGVNLQDAYGYLVVGSTPSNWVGLSSVSDDGVLYWTSGYFLYDVGGFFSNGIHYTAIKVYFAYQSQVQIIGYLNDEGNKIIAVPTDKPYIFYKQMTYYDVNTDVEQVVNTRDLIPYNSSEGLGSSGKYYANTTTWYNDAFRYLTFDTPLTDDVRISLYALNNNLQYSNGFPNGSDNSDNVFTLIASSFTGLIPILSVAILPGITIGMLLFVPLVVTIIWAIISIIKK